MKYMFCGSQGVARTITAGYFSKSRSSCNESIFDSGMHKAITMFEVSLKAHKQLENNFPERTAAYAPQHFGFHLTTGWNDFQEFLAHNFSFSVVVTFCFSTYYTLKNHQIPGPLMSDAKLFSKSLKSNCFWLGAIWPPNTFAQKFFLVFPSSITTSSSNNIAVEARLLVINFNSAWYAFSSFIISTYTSAQQRAAQNYISVCVVGKNVLFYTPFIIICTTVKSLQNSFLSK